MFKFEKILERDIDLLIINKIYCDKNILNLFLSKINLNNYTVEEIEHSHKDNDGESDITVILKNDVEKIGLLIEDKIDAIAMPNQQDRYNTRGNKAIENKKYDRFFVFIIAPKDYLNGNSEAQKYDNKISYEEIREVLKDDLFAVSLIDKALDEKKKGYSVIENENVTQFWQNYYDYIDENYPSLNINRVNGPRGANACWPIFKTPIKYVSIYHKSDRGYIDLTFEKIGDKYYDFINIVSDYLTDEMSVQKANKSLVIRINVPIINFKYSFEAYLDEMKICLDKVLILSNLLKKIDISTLYK